MKIAMAQMKMADSVRENVSAALRYIEQAASERAELVFFPELQFSPFFPARSGQTPDAYLFEQNHEAIRAICEACGRFHISASVNFYLREGDGRYDASLMIDQNGGIAGASKMVHTASFPHFYEAEYYTPSDTGFKVYELAVEKRTVKVGIVICFDRHFPESVRCCALQGAELIIIPTANLTSEPEDMFLWELRVQAMQSSVNIAMCNRVGTEGEITFCGHSTVVDRAGNVLCCADDSEKLIVHNVGLTGAKSPVYLPYRRPDQYGVISRQRKC